MTRRFLCYVCLLTALITESKSQTFNYPDSIASRIILVEDSLINWGMTYEEDEEQFTIQELMKHNGIPGLSIVIINNYQIEWAKTYGMADIKKELPVTINTAFMAASVSKTINAMAILKLAEDEKLDLHADINDLLTDWKFPYAREKGISTYQLLTHTSGIWSHWTSSYNHGSKKPTLINMLNREKSPKDKSKPYLYTYEDPGMKFQYSNAGVSVSQQVLVEVTEMEYEDYIQQTIFDPLRMDNSFYELDKKAHDYAPGYRWNGKQVKGAYRPVVEYAPAGLWTTPTDLAKFVIEVQLAGNGKSEKVLSTESAALMLTQAMTENSHSRNINFGVGTFLSHKGSNHYFFHGGDGSGYTATYIASRDGGKGLVMMLNTENNALIYALINRVAQVYHWPGYLFNEGEKIAAVEVNDDLLDAYTGQYICLEQPLNQLEMKYEGHLQGIISGGEDSYLEFSPLSDTVFWAEGTRLYSHTTITFQKNKNNEINGLVMSNEDIITTWVKKHK